MKFISFAFVSCIVLFASCKKKTDTTVVLPDFLPLTVGSYWTYISNGVSTTLTVSNKDTVALGRTYKVLNSSNGGNQYQAKSGNDCYRFAVLQGLVPNGFEELYLKSDQNVNTTWQLTIPLQVTGTTIPITSKYTITEKGISKTVQGKSYSNVTHVKQELTSILGNNGGGDSYYAAGVGLISSSLAITFPGQNFNTTTELTAYQIK